MSKRDKAKAGIGFFVDIIRAFVAGIIFVAFLTVLWPTLSDMHSKIVAVGAMAVFDPAFIPFMVTILFLSMLGTAISWLVPKPN